ncbi:MAG TPA: amino acid adenylation domain-containing protein, partial [Mycobacteriales bacterium]|nr:amino acid adenylation domain-containing protein [Mycobacteriales bacterium]
LHEIFADQATRSPHATALICGDNQISYTDLNNRADQLAHVLADRGVDRGVLTGICLDRGVDLIVAVLAVLKAGGGYTLLDPAFPTERLRTLLAATGAPMVVTATRWHRQLSGTGAGLLCLDGERAAVSRRRAGGLGRRSTPADVACVMFTSGSTGRPKGVVTPHRALVGTLCGQSYVDFDAGQSWLQCAPVSWDAFALEAFGPLLHGGTCVLQPGQIPDPALIADLITRHAITTVHLSASLLNHLIDEHPGTFDQVRQVMTGGEPASVPHLRRLLDSHPGIRIVNGYSPVESTIFTTSHQVTPADTTTATIPVGRPLAGKQVHVLDPRLRPVPVGVPGELYMAGSGLADGYLGQPAHTAERFVANPHSITGERMYRTGDLVRWRPDGTLDFLGRADHQIKIRGFRIEPAEIATTLSSHPQVAQAAVIVREDTPGDKQLTAYAVPTPEAGAVDPDALRRHVADLLPTHLVPAAIVLLDALPLTPTGKLDRAALPAPARQAGAARGPRTPREEILCGLFAELLGLPQVGIDDDFFALGGHSLLAARLINRIRTTLGADVTIQTLFQHPTIAGIAARLVDGGRGRAALLPAARPAAVPLSFAQQRLWFLNQLDGRSAAYNVPVALRLHGPLDVGALDAALLDVVARHETLRTVFPAAGGVPWQRIEPVAGAPGLPAVDVPAAALAGELAAAAAVPFDLTRDRPLRTGLFRLAADEHVLLLVLHHIASDGWSMGPLLADLGAAYTARAAGGSPQWTPLPVQYADYTLWQREVLGAETDPASVLARQVGYWSRTLADLPAELSLPTDRPRPAHPTGAGDLVPVDLPAELHQQLRDLAHRHHATLFMVVHAALATLLSRHGAGDDLPIGTPVAGRTDDALDHLVGFFINTLVLRTDTAGNPTFAQLLDRVRETDLAAYANQDVPFERLVEIVNPTRTLTRHPLFQVMLVLQNNEPGEPELGGLRAHTEPVEAAASKVDLTLRLGAGTGPGELTGELAYDTELFDRGTVERLVARLGRLLAAVVADPHRPIADIDLLDPAERRALAGWSSSTWTVPEATLPELFERQVARTPASVAVSTDAGPGRAATELTYAGLNRRANRLAHLLIGRGIGPEQLVALTVPRSPEMVVALLAVLKAGAAYLPLDPAHPADRIRFVLDQARPGCLLTTGTGPDWGGTPCLRLDDPAVARELAGAADTDPTDADRVRALRLPHPAYVIYTSGSTGRPKGVVVPHAGLAALAESKIAWLAAGPGSTVLQFSSLSFDSHVSELVAALLTGGRLLVAPAERVLPGEPLARLLADNPVTHLILPPAGLAAMPPGSIPDGVTLSVGGDACPPELVRRWAPGRRMVNSYGPTEATVSATMSDPLVAGQRPPIGRPLAGRRLRVLDANLRPVPVGVPGELYLGGAGLARAYLGAPARTAERFVADPAGPPGARMYRTGDLVRWTPHGTLDFLRRVDDQVKIRGFRIELGEVEAVLGRHPAVRQAAVVVREDRPGDRRLVAYLVAEPASGPAPDPGALRRHVAASVPDYMTPSAYVLLAALPVTSSGKLDRRALPAPAAPAGTGRAPGTRAEKVLCGLFATAVGQPVVGLDDDFFALGGHSLLATRLVAAVRRELGVELSIRDLFEAPTPATLAARLDTPTGADPLAVLLPLRVGGGAAPLFCVHPAAGISWVYSGLRRHLDAGRPIYGLQAPGLRDPDAHPDSVEDLVAAYLTRIRSVQRAGPYHLLGWSFGAGIAHSLAVRLQAAGEQVGLLAMLDGYPAPADRGRLVPGSPEALSALLVSLGTDPARLPDGPLRHDDFLALAARDGGPLAALGEPAAAAVARVFTADVNLARRGPIGRFAGDVVFFTAVEGRTADSPRPQLWREHVTGRLEIHEIACRHGELTQPGPLARIGPVLDRALRPAPSTASQHRHQGGGGHDRPCPAPADPSPAVPGIAGRPAGAPLLPARG